MRRVVRLVGLVVRDLVPVQRFYCEVIGLAVLEASAGRALLGVAGVALLELLERPEALPRDPGAAGLFHTAFLLPGRAALGRWLVHAAAAEQKLDGAADHLVSEAVYLRDPEGNGVEVYADRDPAAWAWVDTAAGPRVRMANAPLDRAGLLGLADRAWDGAPAGTIVGHVHLQVGDVALAAAFQAEVAGMAVTAAMPQAVFLSRHGYHHHLAVNSWNSQGAGVRDPRQAGLAFVTLAGTVAGETVDPWGTVIRFVQSDEDALV